MSSRSLVDVLVSSWVRYAEICFNSDNNYLLLLLLTTIGLLPCGSGYFTCKQNMKLVTTKFMSGGLHEKYVGATWNVGNRLSICF